MKHRQRLYFAGIIVLFFVLVFVYIKKFAIFSYKKQAG